MSTVHAVPQSAIATAAAAAAVS